MATLINTTFFYPPLLEIPQIQEPSVAASVQRFIDIYEPEYLGLLLGPVLQKALTDQPGSDASVALLNGAAYTDGFGLSQHYAGLVGTQGTVKVSPIANYVYCKYWEQNASVSTGTGEKVAQAENAVDASPKYKIARAWNQMVHQNWALIRFVTARPDLYSKQDLPPFSLRYRRMFSPINLYM